MHYICERVIAWRFVEDWEEGPEEEEDGRIVHENGSALGYPGHVEVQTAHDGSGPIDTLWLLAQSVHHFKVPKEEDGKKEGGEGQGAGRSRAAS